MVLAIRGLCTLTVHRTQQSQVLGNYVPYDPEGKRFQEIMNRQLKQDGSCRQFQNRLTRHAFQSGRIAGIIVYSLKDPATEGGICLFPVAVSFFQLLKFVNVVSVL